MKKFSAFFTLLFCVCLRAHASFDFNPNCVQAYRNIVQLNFGKAGQLIAQEKKAHPDNAVIPFLENSSDYYQLIMTHRKHDYDAWKGRRDGRISKISSENSNSPYYRYMQAHIHLQWALLYSQFGEFTAAGFAINKAYGLLQANQKKYPTFLPDDIDLAMVNVLLGSIPDGTLKSSLRFFGIKGDRQTGLRMLEQLAVSLPKSGYSAFYDELVFYLTHVQCDIVQDPQAFAKAIKYAQPMPDSALKHFILGYCGIRTGHSREALEWLNEDGLNRRFPVLYYFEGVARLNLLDSGAKTCFRQFLSMNPGAHYIKDAYLRLGWIAALSGQPQQTKAYFALVREKGNTYENKDKQAMNEIADLNPNPVLLRARLLCDGGAYEKAAATLAKTPATDFTGRNRLEYLYRSGRINEELGDSERALTQYAQSISIGKNTKYYFAANSALHAGNIWQKKGDHAKAKTFYNQALAMKNFEYEESIKHKVRTAIRQIGG